jgi:hypothetical protein
MTVGCRLAANAPPIIVPGKTVPQKPCSIFMTATGMTEINERARPMRTSVRILM